MHSFAVVVAKPGRLVPPHVHQVLGEGSPAELPFIAESQVRWSDDRGRTVYGGWQAAASSLGAGSHWELRPGGLTAFSGHLWHRRVPWAPGSSWAAQLADRFERAPLVTALEDHDGVYTAVSIATTGTGCLTSDPLGFGALYRAESDDVIVFSTRSSLAARLVTPAGRVPARDVEGVASLAYCTYVMADRTGFEGVTTLPPGSYVSLSPAAPPEVITWSTRPWLPNGDQDPGDLAAMVKGVREDLAASVRTFATVPAASRMSNLTGGKDTRLVLALLLSEGLADRFAYNTFGSAALPDCVVASAIADRFGLDHRAASRPGRSGAPHPAATTPARPPETVEERMRHHVWATSGMLSTWDLRNLPRRQSADVVVTGLFGEAFRTIYRPKASRRSWRAPFRKRPARLGATMDDLLDQVYGTGHGFDSAGIFRTEAREHFESQIEAELTAMQPDDGGPRDALDGFYLAGRLRRWFGPQPDTDAHPRVYPLYSLTAMRSVFALGAHARWSEVLPFEIMRATCEELATMPFAESAWPDGAVSHLQDAKRFQPPPVTAARKNGNGARVPPTQTVNQENQHHLVNEKIETLRAQLDLGTDHPLFEMIDRTALIRAVDSYTGLGLNARRGVEGAVTAAMWLSGAEARYSAGEEQDFDSATT